MMTYVITQYLSTLLGRSLSHLTVKHVKIKITKLKIDEWVIIYFSQG